MRRIIDMTFQKNIVIMKSAQVQMHLKSRGKNKFNVFVFQMYLLL